MRRCSILLAVLAVYPLLLLVASAIPVQAQGKDEPVATRVGIFYDSTQSAHLLWGYTFRVLVVEDLVGSGFQCWTTFPNGTYGMDPERCRPVSGLKLRIWYAELKESEEVETGPDGIAAVTKWRLFSYPAATFRVEAKIGEDVIVREFKVYPQPWSLAAITSFAAMVSTMVLVLRRGVW
jgi:hypothetical protein